MSKFRTEQKKELLWKMKYSRISFESMYKRLRKKADYNFNVTLYYSFILLFYSLSQIVFTSYYTTMNNLLTTFFSFILSSFLVVYSLINKNKYYSERALLVKQSSDKIKEYELSLSMDITKTEEIYNKFESVMRETEDIEDIDSFSAIKQLCREHNLIWWWVVVLDRNKQYTEDQNRIITCVKQLKPFVLQSYIIKEYIWRIFLILAPIAIFIISVYFEQLFL